MLLDLLPMMATVIATPKRGRGRRGFTLVELSIVMVVIGLILGGVLVGQHMIRAAELNKIATDKTRYFVALNTFKTKYFYLPGDITNATQFWPASSSCPSISAPGTTCNGNGDRYIGLYDGSNSVCGEVALAWQHLALSGMIQGGFTGAPGGNWCALQSGVNAPVSSFSAQATFTFWSNPTGLALAFSDFTKPNLIFGSGDGTKEAMFPALTPEDAANLDRKTDDGRPGTGRSVTFRDTANYYGNVGCITSNDPDTAQYNLSQTGIKCAMIFVQ